MEQILEEVEVEVGKEVSQTGIVVSFSWLV